MIVGVEMLVALMRKRVWEDMIMRLVSVGKTVIVMMNYDNVFLAGFACQILNVK